MNQNGRDDLAIYLGLQDFEVTFRSDFEVTSKGRFEVTLVEVETSRRRGRIKVVSVARRSGTHRCPSCGREHATGLFEEAEAIRLRNSSIGDCETYLEVEPMRGRRCAPGCRSRWWRRWRACRGRRWRRSGDPAGTRGPRPGSHEAALDRVDEVSWTGGRKYFRS